MKVTKKRKLVLSAQIVLLAIFLSSCSYRSIDQRVRDCEWDKSCKDYDRSGGFFYYPYFGYYPHYYYPVYGNSLFYSARSRISSGESHLFTSGGKTVFKSGRYAGSTVISKSFISGSRSGIGTISRGGIGSIARGMGGGHS
jgi:hypothetical protein